VNEVGCFGKVPAHGDFVWQALPARFVTPWDNWLQSEMLDIREQLGEEWLETYLCGPIWRFLIQDEALGASTWCGIISPSVDVVGRYFPITLATTLPRFTSLAHAPGMLAGWYKLAEDSVLSALSQTLSVEEMLEPLRRQPPPEVMEYEQVEAGSDTASWSGTANEGEDWSASMLHTLVYQNFDQPCLWSSLDHDSGSVRYRVTEGFQGFTDLFTVSQ
jgi:type VI secretion system protein ImpM